MKHTFLIMICILLQACGNQNPINDKTSEKKAGNKFIDSGEVKEEIAIMKSDSHPNFDDTVSKCNWNHVYDLTEHFSPYRSNRFVGLIHFKMDVKDCWRNLAEMYYNMLPDTMTKYQYNIYLISVPDASKKYKVTSLIELLNDSFLRQKVIGVFKHNLKNRQYSFISLPFL